jgi:hypothetical protein
MPVREQDAVTVVTIRRLALVYACDFLQSEEANTVSNQCDGRCAPLYRSTHWSSNSRWAYTAVGVDLRGCMTLLVVQSYGCAPGNDGFGKRSEWCSSMSSRCVWATVCMRERCTPCATRHLLQSPGMVPRNRKDIPGLPMGWHMRCCMQQQCMQWLHQVPASHCFQCCPHITRSVSGSRLSRVCPGMLRHQHNDDRMLLI